jgi:hypothetical protein
MALHVELRHIYRDGSSGIDGNQIAARYECSFALLEPIWMSVDAVKAEILGDVMDVKETPRHPSWEASLGHWECSVSRGLYRYSSTARAFDGSLEWPRLDS